MKANFIKKVFLLETSKQDALRYKQYLEKA